MSETDSDKGVNYGGHLHAIFYGDSDCVWSAIVTKWFSLLIASDLANLNPILPPFRPLFSYLQVCECLPEYLDRRLTPYKHVQEMFFGSRGR